MPTEHLSAAQVKAMMKPTKTPKYRNVKTIVDGVKFDSKKEAKRFGELKLQQAAGHIRNLKPHPCWSLVVNDVIIGTYTADASYFDLHLGILIVEDVKCGSTKTTAYRLRKRLMLAIHGIKIVEV